MKPVPHTHIKNKKSSGGETTDLLQALSLSTLPQGVTRSQGRCHSSHAFHLGQEAQVVAPARDILPGTYRDFSLLATVRIKQGSRPVLLALYDANGSERLALRLGTDVLLAYQDKNKRPPPQRFPLFPAVNIADGRWHRVALSVHKRSATLYVDCVPTPKHHLQRSLSDNLPNNGVLLLGRTVMEDEALEVRNIPSVNSTTITRYLFLWNIIGVGVVDVAQNSTIYHRHSEETPNSCHLQSNINSGQPVRERLGPKTLPVYSDLNIQIAPGLYSMSHSQSIIRVDIMRP
uniref:Thrombospondin-like N-terminal domain-containing protein n=1 Tax=Eptatretus burgeri TaxID=7764 RepID=A0A8C4Q067_EPTBU